VTLPGRWRARRSPAPPALPQLPAARRAPRTPWRSSRSRYGAACRPRHLTVDDVPALRHQRSHAGHRSTAVAMLAIAATDPVWR